MATDYSIDDIKKLFSDRAGTRGVSSNVTPDKFNRWFNSAELKFFNQRYDEYSRKQTISDSISKWMSDPMYIPVDANGLFPFFTNMNLLHVDSLSSYLVTTGTKIATFKTLVGGSAYTDGTYTAALTGGTGSGAKAYFVIDGGVVVSVTPTLQGTGYALNDVLSVAVGDVGGTGTGFSITVASLTGAVTEYPIGRVEKQRWAKHLSSTYDFPTQEFGIYSQFADHLEFAPQDLGFAKIVYLQQPVWSKWGYDLSGYIATVTGLPSGSAYTDGQYSSVPLTGGSGTGVLATVVVSGGAVTSVTITNQGKNYQVNDTLSALAANLGGTGTGFAITVSSLVAGSIRATYNAAKSIQPRWNNDDISSIIDLALSDAAISARDVELTRFANDTSRTQQ